jgi:uncharacterized protein (DUF2252 family)
MAKRDVHRNPEKPMTRSTIVQREAAGRAVRERVKRSSHKLTGEMHRDPLELLRIDSEGRVPGLVPLRNGRMAVSPFAFFCGSAILQAHDLSLVPDTGMAIPVCGDAHLLNFGGFATPERQVVFDLNDFDEAAPGPWEWDLKRLAVSLVMAARHLRHSRGAAESFVMAAVTSYRNRTRQYAQSSALDLWYERITFDHMLETVLTPEGRRTMRRGMEKAAGRTPESMLEKLAQREGDRWAIRDLPPVLFHVPGASTRFEPGDDWFATGDWREHIGPMYESYAKTLAQDRRELLDQFTLQDLVFKVGGLSSAGARSLVALLVDDHEKPLFLQIKEARRSVISQYFRSPELRHDRHDRHEGARVAHGQRLLQAAADLFLGWSTGPSGGHYAFRQLRDMKLAVELELLDSTLLEGYARLCGWAMARAHAKSGNAAVEISAYIGRNDQFAEALTSYAFAWADQVERDYDVFLKAVRSGKIPTRNDDNMGTGLRA